MGKRKATAAEEWVTATAARPRGIRCTICLSAKLRAWVREVESFMRSTGQHVSRAELARKLGEIHGGPVNEKTIKIHADQRHEERRFGAR